jgi:hypothetical protein
MKCVVKLAEELVNIFFKKGYPCNCAQMFFMLKEAPYIASTQTVNKKNVWSKYDFDLEKIQDSYTRFIFIHNLNKNLFNVHSNICNLKNCDLWFTIWGNF